MTIGESQIGTVVRCDRCGRIIETISGAQFVNRTEPTASPNLSSPLSAQPDIQRSEQSSVYQTPIIKTNNQENSHTEQSALETEKMQPDQLNQLDQPDQLDQSEQLGQREQLGQAGQAEKIIISNAANANVTNAANAANVTLTANDIPAEVTSDTVEKIDMSGSTVVRNVSSKNPSQNSDDFTLNSNAKKSTVIFAADNIGGYGVNKKTDWRHLISDTIISDTNTDTNTGKNIGANADKNIGAKDKSTDPTKTGGDNKLNTPPIKLSNDIGTVAAANDAETLFVTNGINNKQDSPTQSGGSRNTNTNKSTGYSEAGRFGSTINLDLTKRVMGTINKSGGDSTDTIDKNDGGYGVHRILKQHQRGGMGRIMIAYDRHLKRDVALKELHKEVVDDISIVRRFVGEAEITAQLEHPGIVPIHWLGLDKDGLPYYTMKLIRGKTYQDAIKEYHRNPSKQELKSLIRRLVSICKTIGFAHERGVIHRDLKPANIMLGEHGETLVMDWGLAKPLNRQQNENEDDEDEYNTTITRMSSGTRTELTMVGAIVGTPAFMSPEQASPEENIVGTHSDIYSLGTILYYLLTGQTAFSGRSTREVLAKVRAASPIKPSDIKMNVPSGLEAICLKAMAKDPKNRYQTTKEMDEDLCRWLDDIPVKAMRITIIQKFFRCIIKHWIAAISIPIVMTSIIMLAVIIIKYDRTYNASASEEIRRIALEDEVDLTEQDCIAFRGGHNVIVEKQDRLIGGKMVVCKVKAETNKQTGLLEILAPANSTWNLTNRKLLQFSVFENRSGAFLPFDNLKIRLGRGSAYFEIQPSKTNNRWENRKSGNWATYQIPLTDFSQDWSITLHDNPQFENIDWIEFHFETRPEYEFQIDDIKFIKNK
jgi:tRNA A-37 threonylcarbamoyl transferase component Bud32